MQSEFLLTIAAPSQFPGLFRDEFMKGHREPRIAMVGKSNVGKSSLINALLEFRLAQTSNQPGKTRAIHFYHWKKIGKIVADLPGYGYAKAARTERERWESFIGLYFEEDQNLERVVLLLDARHGPTEVDMDAIQFLRLKGIPTTFVFAKVDTLRTQSDVVRRKREATQALSSLRVNPNDLFWVSSREKTGLKALIQRLGSE